MALKVSVQQQQNYFLKKNTTFICTLDQHLKQAPLLFHTEFDINNEFPIDTLPENVDGYIYFPGSINLRPFERFSIDDFMNDLNINYLANIKILQKIMPKLKKSQNDASVVFFSTVAVQTGMPFHASIAGAKGALEGLTKSLAPSMLQK